MVRQFARWLNAIEPRHQVPPRGLMDVRHRRGKPYIYSDGEIARLMAEAARLKSPKRMNALTLEILIGLLAATGLRPGEAAALEMGDVDLEGKVLDHPELEVWQVAAGAHPSVNRRCVETLHPGARPDFS